MKLANLLFFLPFMISLSHSAPTPLYNLQFDGGYNLSKLETELNDNESKDMCNCIVESDGGLTKRNGSRRYVDQAVSTYPVMSLFRYYASSGSKTNKTLLTVVGNKILHSTGGIKPVLMTLSSTNIAVGDRWNWLTFNNEAIGVSPNNKIKKFNINTSSLTDLIKVDGSSGSIDVQAKYAIMAKNYFIAGNVTIATFAYQSLTTLTTYYPSRIYYSLFLQPSSMTINRYIEYRTDDGGEITGLGNQFDRTHIFKPTSIGELFFTVLNLPSVGGDWQLNEVVSDFGLEAPMTLAQRSGFYILGSKDGIRTWDGGRRARSSAGEETELISKDIQPLIEKLIKAGTYKDSVGKYYPRRDWYLFFYNDPDKFPKGKLNSAIFYDFKIAKWFPICNWTGNVMEVFPGSQDNGELFYGDSADGYIYEADILTDDARKELQVDSMDSSTTWISSSRNAFDFVEGTASLSMGITGAVTESSMTLVKVLPFGEWNDKTRVTKNDKLSFKVYPTNQGNVTNLRIDLLVDDVENAFNLNFTSVTISSVAFVSGNRQWSTIEIALSSFPISSDWTDLNVESVPFAETLTYYGLRFVMNGIAVSSITIDDVRLVQDGNNPVKFSWTSKLFNFGDISVKNFGQTILTYEKSPESVLKADFLNDFGQKSNTVIFEKETGKELIVVKSTSILEVLNSVDFSLIKSSSFNTNEFQFFNGNSNGDFIVINDRTKHRLVKIDRKNFGTIVSTFFVL